MMSEIDYSEEFERSKKVLAKRGLMVSDTKPYSHPSNDVYKTLFNKIGDGLEEDDDV